jgi:hypothetical protein
LSNAHPHADIDDHGDLESSVAECQVNSVIAPHNDAGTNRLLKKYHQLFNAENVRLTKIKRIRMEYLSKGEPSLGLEDQQTPTGLFKVLARYVPYFRNPRHILVFKLDCLLLTWTFIAGILKEMDQSATAQAYVSGMKESLHLYGNELINFNTFFSVGYAIGLIPGQLIQTKVS